MASGQYFDAEPTVGSRPTTVPLELPDLRVQLRVDRGVFSAGRVDPGTMILLRGLPPLGPGTILDLGCGYGPIACALAHRARSSTVWAVDVNQRALDLTAANATALGLDNVRTAVPDALPSDVRFTAIVSNPPIRVGKPALHELLERWMPLLSPTGEAWLVVHRHLGADSLGSWLTTIGWRVERRSSKQGYRVLRLTADASGPAGGPGPAGPPGPAGAPGRGPRVAPGGEPTG